MALKNAYALGVALAIGLAYKREGKALEHYNSQAGLFMQASREMYLLLDVFESTAERNIFVGLGDLYVDWLYLQPVHGAPSRHHDGGCGDQPTHRRGG